VAFSAISDTQNLKLHIDRCAAQISDSSKEQGCGEEKKMGGGGCKRIFFKILGVLRNFLDVKKVFTKLLKVGGVHCLIFPSDDLFLNKNTDFCWKKAKIFKRWGVRTLLHPVVATSLPKKHFIMLILIRNMKFYQ
jgi:hypothetical protein